MKASIIGTGKTGSEVTQLLDPREIHHVFNSRHKPTVETLKESDVAIIFVPKSAVHELLPIILQSGVTAVWASTGYTWPKDLHRQLIQHQTRWVISSNYSLSMHLIKQCVDILKKSESMMEQPHFLLNEIHHVHKEDTPSGTALNWRGWLERDCPISSERIADHQGTHELIVKTSDETISLKHVVHNRKVFAKGAVWAARYLMDNPQLPFGIHQFADIVDRVFGESTYEILDE